MTENLGVTAAMETAAAVLGCEVDHSRVRTEVPGVLTFISLASDLQFATHALKHHDRVLDDEMAALEGRWDDESTTFASGVVQLMADQETKRDAAMRELVALMPELVAAGVLKANQS